jgi:hypothetical protein
VEAPVTLSKDLNEPTVFRNQTWLNNITGDYYEIITRKTQIENELKENT